MKYGIFNFHNKKQESAYTMVKLSDIKTHEDIHKLFTVSPDMVEKISISMKKMGYDFAQPLVVGTIGDIGEYLVDGHTRLKAAISAGITEVPTKHMEFESLKEALQYTFRRQAERRNLTDRELLIAAELMPKNDARDGSGRSVEKLAKELGVSSSTMVHARTVAKKADESIKEAIKTGEMSLHEGYRKIKSERPKEQAFKPEKMEKNIIEKQDDNNQVKNLKLVNADDILRLLAENKEFNAVKLLLSKYRNSVSTVLLSELGF